MQAFLPDYIRYDEAPFRDAFTADMRRPGLVESMAETGWVICDFDTWRYPLAQEITRILQSRDYLPAQLPDDFTLDRLHERVPAEFQAMDRTQQSALAIALYETDERFMALYRRFIAGAVKRAVGSSSVYYQQTPTFRVFFPDGPGYPGRTTYHCDIMLGHPPREVNIWVPLANCAETRSMLLMDLPDSKAIHEAYDFDFKRFGVDTQINEDLIAQCDSTCRPVTIDYGQFIMFDSRCIHAGPLNRTGLTRASFDIRVVPADEFHAMPFDYRGNGRRQSRFVPGDYYAPDSL